MVSIRRDFEIAETMSCDCTQKKICITGTWRDDGEQGRIVERYSPLEETMNANAHLVSVSPPVGTQCNALDNPFLKL